MRPRRIAAQGLRSGSTSRFPKRPSPNSRRLFSGGPYAPASDQARRRAHPAAARLRRADLRGQLRRTGRGARARGQRRRRAGDRPLRDRRAPDLRVRDPHRVAGRAGADRVAAADVRGAGDPHPPRDRPLRAAVDVLDVRLPDAVRRARRPGFVRVRNRQGRRAHRRRRPHRPRRHPRRTDRRRARLAAGARRRRQRAASGRAAVAGARGPSVRLGSGHGGVDRPLLRARRLRVELPRRRARSGSASARSTHGFTCASRPCGWPPTCTPTRSVTRATGSPTRCATPPRTACSSSATPPATACR